MNSPFKWLLTTHLKSSQLKLKSSGFTLIELLVALVLAFLIITPLLGFLVNILDTDRKEQAKVNTEQDIRAALDYISRDLQQAVYIYDADGIAAIRSQLPSSSTDTRFPVLVFWKRQFISDGLRVSTSFDDTFSYSLIAYYLIKDTDSTWSNAARIGRFQISNGYGSTATEIESTRDRGFNMFDLSQSGSLKARMNAWVKSTGEDYTQQILPLVDYIDQTRVSQNATLSPPQCPINPVSGVRMQQVPNYALSGNTGSSADDKLKTGSFYICVDASQTVAEVYLRGNALARIQNNTPTYNTSQSSYFPQASIRVQGRGFLFKN